jgi:hypothetical protein|tara:strand:- start:1682 stop:2086 length:405 start_codon:yes stop_codon:yes gene_type:complete
MNLRILLILLLATCNGCTLLGNDPYVPEVKPVEVVTITKPAAVYHPPLPNKVNTKPVEWTVLTPAIMSEYLTDLEKGEAPTNVYYGISPTGYENLSVNMAELKRYIRQVLSIVDYYQKLDKQEDADASKKEEKE